MTPFPHRSAHIAGLSRRRACRILGRDGGILTAALPVKTDAGALLADVDHGESVIPPQWEDLPYPGLRPSLAFTIARHGDVNSAAIKFDLWPGYGFESALALMIANEACLDLDVRVGVPVRIPVRGFASLIFIFDGLPHAREAFRHVRGQTLDRRKDSNPDDQRIV